MKTKPLFIIVIFFFFSVVAYAQRKRALLVGISHYDSALTGYQWDDINGTNDIHLISPLLKEQGFSLISLLDEQATFDRIINRLNFLVNETRKGDIIYIHFSTHGQPVEDLDSDEDDGWDEAIVPIDAYKIYRKGIYEGKKHLTDDILNKYVIKLRERIGPKGFLYIVIDACHAGTSSRGNDGTIRGTHVGFSSHNKIYKPSISKKSHYRIETSPKLSPVLFLEACRPDQINTEIKVGNKKFGPLSYNIAQALEACTLTTNATVFLKLIKESLMQKGRWPSNQNLVTETSY